MTQCKKLKYFKNIIALETCRTIMKCLPSATLYTKKEKRNILKHKKMFLEISEMFSSSLKDSEHIRGLRSSSHQYWTNKQTKPQVYYN